MPKVLVVTLILFSTNVLFAQSAKLRLRVLDSSGAVIPKVQVKVYQADKLVGEGLTSSTGDFDIPVDPSDYKVEITAADFQPHVENVKVTGDSVLLVTMKLAQLNQTIDVKDVVNQVSIDADSSLKTTVLEKEFVEALPDEVDDLVAYLQQIAGSRGEAGADATFMIDGFTSGRIPPKDQIQDIRINNNPFSAEFSGAGFGRTEIISKAGTGDFHGNANFLFRDAPLNARNPFATIRPPYQQRNFNSSLSGPVIPNKLTLNLNVRDNENENSDTVRAIVPTGQLSDAVVMPNINRAGNARGQWALTPNNTVAFNLDYQRIHNENQGIGGFILAERAWTRHAQNTEYQLRETAVLNKQLVHEARFSYRRDYSRTNPISDNISLDVLDAFNGGGAQNKSVNDNRTVEFGDLWIYSSGPWSFKTGGQLLRRLNHNENYNNFGGTFTFSSLADYLAKRPVTFSKNQGNPFVTDAQIEVATFFQSDWKVSRVLNLSLGARYETQTNVSVNNLDPRLGFAYQLSNTVVLRGGIGMFHQRLSQVAVDQLLRFDGVHQQQFVIRFPTYPDPFANGTAAAIPVSVRVKSPVLLTPYNVINDFSLEKSLPKGLALTISWDATRGVHLYRGRNINAPFPGSLIRPNPAAGNIVQLESSASSRSNNFTMGFRQTLRNKWNLNAFGNYTLGWNYNDTDGNFSLPENNYDLQSEWGRAPADQRHRFVAGLNFRTFWNIGVNANVQANSNRPYNITTGFDDNGDTNTNDRPAGIKRNTGIGPRYFNVNLSFQKTVSLRSEAGRTSAKSRLGPNMTLILNSWNAFNHPQYQNYSGVMTSTFFGHPNRANNPRNVEVGMRLTF
jgi:Carboxypeptidase regulatory-like domain/TonB dependent receptor